LSYKVTVILYTPALPAFELNTNVVDVNVVKFLAIPESRMIITKSPSGSLKEGKVYDVVAVSSLI
jgi:hypothetical protein